MFYFVNLQYRMKHKIVSTTYAISWDNSVEKLYFIVVNKNNCKVFYSTLKYNLKYLEISYLLPAQN